jgi:TDG/mug DNA glycosylase family protein
MSQLFSFPPIAAPDASCLILGSMPGTASLAAQQYYAHPRNAFWPLLLQILDLPETLSYAERCQALRQHRIAVWDVLLACKRRGSLDADIEPESIVANDFAGFLAAHPQIRVLYFNGATAANVYKRLVLPLLPPAAAALPRVQLPSTSPAHATLDFGRKLANWNRVNPALY